MSKNGVLSPQEAAVLVSIVDGGDETNSHALQRIADQFLQQFKEDTGARTRAIYAIRALLGADFVAGSCSTPTTPETIACLFLLHAVANNSNGNNGGNGSSSSGAAENAEYARAALYEHLLRVDDLLRDDSLLTEQRKYKATAAVGKRQLALAHDAAERDAQRGHLLQKVFIVQCCCAAAGAAAAQLLPGGNVADAARNAPQVCKAAPQIEGLEAVVASWGAPEKPADGSAPPPCPLRQAVLDAVGALRRAYEREHVLAAACALNAHGFGGKGIEMPDGTAGASNNVLRSSRLGPRHLLASPALAHPLSQPAFLAAPLSGAATAAPVSPTSSSSSDSGSAAVTPQGAPASFTFHAAIRPPPRGRVGLDARLLLPPGAGSPLIFDASPHPADWREAKAIIDAAAGTADVGNAQLQKLTALLGNSSSNGAKAAAPGKSGAAGTSSPSAAAGGGKPLDLFAYLGVTPAVFGAIARSNAKVATVLAQRLEKSNGGPYVMQLVDFNNSSSSTSGVDLSDAPSVLLAAARNGLVTPAHLAVYVARARQQVQATADQKVAVEFLKSWAVTLHQVAEKCPLEASDKQTVVALLGQFGDALNEVSKLWTS